MFYFLETTAAGGDPIGSMLMLVIPLALLYFFMIMPQRKKDKKLKAMIAALKMYDEIVTIGGIYGKIVRIKDDTLFIESTTDKTKIQIARWAVKEVTKQSETEE